MVFVFGYILMSAVVGMLGIGRPLGFLGNFIGALVLTPLFWLLLLAFAARVNDYPMRPVVISPASAHVPGEDGPDQTTTSASSRMPGRAVPQEA